MNKTKRFAIVGGGIGGLTLAIALQRKGFRTAVYERAPEIKPIGAGLALAANAMKAFAEIGIDTDILSSGKVLKKLTIKDVRGNILTETNAESISKKIGVTNNFTIHRAALHRVLVHHLQPDTIELGKACINFENSTSGITLNFDDGSTARADYVIACDGIHSIFRKKLSIHSEPRYAGYTCWRGVIDTIPDYVDHNETSETWGPGSRFGIVPLANNQLYWFACINASANDPVMKNFTVSDLASYFHNFHKPIAEIIAQTRDDRMIWGDIIDLKPINQFAFGNIVLMGDAAHATTPNMGQGACLAIEDGVILANCLEAEGQPEIAFRKFESRRLARTRKIVDDSWRLGRIAQLDNRFLIWLRNAAVRATPARVAERQMRFLSDVSF